MIYRHYWKEILGNPTEKLGGPKETYDWVGNLTEKLGGPPKKKKKYILD